MQEGESFIAQGLYKLACFNMKMRPNLNWRHLGPKWRRSKVALREMLAVAAAEMAGMAARRGSPSAKPAYIAGGALACVVLMRAKRMHSAWHFARVAVRGQLTRSTSLPAPSCRWARRIAGRASTPHGVNQERNCVLCSPRWPSQCLLRLA